MPDSRCCSVSVTSVVYPLSSDGRNAVIGVREQIIFLEIDDKVDRVRGLILPILLRGNLIGEASPAGWFDFPFRGKVGLRNG